MQTGIEWYLRLWYDRPWNCVIRHPNSKVRELIAELAVKAAKNGKIGYDQDKRVTYWSQLQKVGYDPSKIIVPCEEDCSAGVMANVKAAGYLLDIEALKNVPITSTWYMRENNRECKCAYIKERNDRISSASMAAVDNDTRNMVRFNISHFFVMRRVKVRSCSRS